MTQQLPKIGRVLFGIPFIMFGLFHFMKGGQMAGMLSGWPAAQFFVYLSGAGLVLGGIAIVIDKKAQLASLLLALELLLFILFIHLPGMGSEEMRQTAMQGMLKDLALIGGALLIAGMKAVGSTGSSEGPG